MPPVTRFAPSPTGHLHLGHLVNALYVWGVARARGGRVRLRIEDHDRTRARPQFERSILDDLEWFGLCPDEPAIERFRAGPCDGRQSDHPERYERALARLAAAGLVYWCDCSRTRVARESGTVGGELRYDGHCRHRNLGPGAGRGARVRLDPGVEPFVDDQLGPQAQDPALQAGDLLARDRHGNWTYQFSVVVDDLIDGITLVVRGTDLLASTGRQIRLARLLGRATPLSWLHHPLIVDADGRKLSKSRGDTGLGQLRAAGLRPDEVLGRAAAAVGLVPPGTRVGIADLPSLAWPLGARGRLATEAPRHGAEENGH